MTLPSEIQFLLEKYSVKLYRYFKDEILKNPIIIEYFESNIDKFR